MAAPVTSTGATVLDDSATGAAADSSTAAVVAVVSSPTTGVGSAFSVWYRQLHPWILWAVSADLGGLDLWLLGRLVLGSKESSEETLALGLGLLSLLLYE